MDAKLYDWCENTPDSLYHLSRTDSIRILVKYFCVDSTRRITRKNTNILEFLAHLVMQQLAVLQSSISTYSRQNPVADKIIVRLSLNID